jgi:hypothetical protein
MAKIKLFVKDVDVNAIRGTRKYRARPLRDEEYLAVFHIAEPVQELLKIACLFLAPGEIQVAIDTAAASKEGVVRAAPQDRYRPNKAHGETRLAGSLQDPVSLGF